MGGARAALSVVFIPAGTTHGSTTLMTGGSARAMFYELKD